MAVNPRQSKIDALLASIEIGSDEKVIKTRCHGLQLADFPLILTQLCLKPKPGATAVKVDSVEAVIKAANDENVAVATTTTTAEKEDGPAVESTEVVKSPPSYLSVVKSGFGNKQTKQTTVTPTGKICKKLMDTGACEEKKSCQHLHPVKCSYYASFGLARTNPKGCKSTDCKFLHVVICRFKYKALCKKQLCSLQHLQPKAVEKKAKVQPEIVHHQPKKAPTTAASTVSFLDQGLDQRMSKIEGLLMMMIQQRGLPPAPSGWPLGTLGEAYSNVSLK
jgi:hypothetical protein